ncbi:PLP-dependent aminotransferase family protein [Galbitalea sp. SE-J8]|uniref:MocR-like transcription factor YczR n=1 Tax=Galbitalea sp. SE-J8 TaxID=3054952 RepID=UPI00259C9652|nr:PLP-dependent aminotransferase family protein [Galbitalea sp. SE-J8]MDM4762212.1 PLP-dependent aminotransferase family protein [Galbitalea sp. SE-J8]
MTAISARALRLLLDDWRTTGPAYAALADRIRLLVLDGRVPIASRLPAERELAEALRVSRTTITAAYAHLREAGYLDSVRGSGSVARLPGRAPVNLDAHRPGYLDFSKAALPAIPDIADAVRRAADRLPAHLGDSGFDPVGLPELRSAIAERYTRRGLPTDADQVMVTVGAQSAIGLVTRTLLSRGDRALIEAPSYPHAIDALRAAGARVATVPVSADAGWDEDVLDQVLRGVSPTLGYLMPDFHNPTGRSMSPELRERTLTLAARQGTVLVADETMAELAIDAPDVAPFAAFDPAKLAITIGSVGKTLWGGIRIGWIRAERSVIQRLVRARSTSDLGTPILEQLVVADLLERYDDIIAVRREQLRAGRDHLERALADAIPEWRVPRVQGGLTAWINLGAPVSSQLVLAARTRGLLLAAGPRFGVDGAFERFLRLPISYSAQETDAAVAALRDAWVTLVPDTFADPSFLAEVV